MIPQLHIWRPFPAAFRQLEQDMTADVVVIGAGVAGLTTAYLAVDAGHSVIVLDAVGPAAGMTARSTAHIATMPDGGWRAMAPTIGVAAATIAATAYREGVQTIAEIQTRESIACDFAWVDGFLVGNYSQRWRLEDEMAAAVSVGLSDTRFAAASPFPTQPELQTLCVPRQARLHPLKYIAGLADAIERRGGILRQARARAVIGDAPATVAVKGGLAVRARQAVVFARNSQRAVGRLRPRNDLMRSYVIALPVAKGTVADAVSWDLDKPYHYTRLQPGTDDKTDMLLVGGEDHAARRTPEARLRYARLLAWAMDRFPITEEPVAQWSGTLKTTIDNLGYMGRVPGAPGRYIIDGDAGLGFNHATVGARIITDLIGGRSNPWTDVFDPARYFSIAPDDRQDLARDVA